MISSATSSLLDQIEYDAPQAFLAPVEADHVRQRHAFEQLCHRQLKGSIARHCRVHRSSNAVTFRFDIGVKLSLADDAERQLHHTRPDVQDLAVVPLGRHAFPVLAHYARISRNAVAVEGGLCEAALVAVLVSFAQQHAFAEEPPGTLLSSAFEEVVVMVDQNVP